MPLLRSLLIVSGVVLFVSTGNAQSGVVVPHGATVVYPHSSATHPQHRQSVPRHRSHGHHRVPTRGPGYLWQGGAPIAHDGFGYIHDPYRRGRFDAPDLLEDPLFQAQHKFDSHFPGRYTPQQKLEYQRNAWKQFHR